MHGWMKNMGCAAALLATAAIVAAENFPTKPIRLLVPYSPGGTTDMLGRILGQKFKETLGEQMIVDNRPGGFETIAADIVAKSSPDGYTLGLFLSPYAVNPFVLKKMPYDTVKDFSPVTLVVIVPGVMVINPGVNAKSLQELVALAKAKPGSLNYASPGPLTSGHLSMELLKSMAGIDIAHIPYKGSAPAMTDLIAGQIQIVITGPASTLANIAAGRVRPVATTGAQRSKSLPEIPTIAESGYPGYETYEWYGIFAPARTPKPIVDQLQREVAKIIQTPDMQKRMQALYLDPIGSSPEDFARFAQQEMQKMGSLVKKIGMQAD
jgi:tripartite-type tricarboxylate transporter receptor subunit TctC